MRWSSSALAFAKIDLDPAAGQKLAIYQLAKRFPSTGEKVKDQDSVKDELLAALFDREGVDYDRDIAPWIGDRVGIAAVPGAGGEPEPLAALRFGQRLKRYPPGLTGLRGLGRAEGGRQGPVLRQLLDRPEELHRRGEPHFGRSDDHAQLRLQVRRGQQDLGRCCLMGAVPGPREARIARSGCG